MSWIANVMLHGDMDDRDVIAAVNAWLRTEAPRRPGPASKDIHGNEIRGVGWLADLTAPDDNHWGGWKHPECDVWAGALNHADLSAVVSFIAEAPWRFPERVQLFLMDQEESYFRLYMRRNGQWRQYAPPPPADADEQHAW